MLMIKISILCLFQNLYKRLLFRVLSIFSRKKLLISIIPTSLLITSYI